ncbi:MAG TPA: glycosyltransferase [Caldilineales bacterium]|nr:glycosyltransferase [Caldilineales bacterium]
MRVLAFSIDLPGHLDWGGYLKTARELTRRGHDVMWVSGPMVKAQVRAAGVAFTPTSITGWRHALPPIRPDLSPQQREMERMRRAIIVWLDAASVLAAVQALEEVADAFRPDVIMTEPFAAAGAILAERRGLPLVVVGRPAQPPKAPNPRRLPNPAIPFIERLLEQAGMEGRYWDLDRGHPRSPHLHLDFFCREWYADLKAVEPQTHFCGGAPAPPQSLALPPDARPLLLVTLGSTFANDENFFRIAAESALLSVARPLLVTGQRTPHILASLRQAPPGPAIIRDWISYDKLFPRLAGAVHHGGVATTHAALVHGVPQVVVPHAGDQYPQAARVTQAGVGYGIRPRDFTIENAPLILADILWDPEFQENARRLAAIMQGLGGPAAAANAVEMLL